MAVDLKKIKTEERNIKTMNIDKLEIKEIVTLINEEDKLVALAVEQAKDQISSLVEQVVKCFENDGRLIYMGAGTSGRVGIIDAVECRPTFGVDDEMVQCLMAGGINAFVKAVEGAEDNCELAINDLKSINFSKNDCLIGIAASGRTPYVVSGCKYAKSIGAVTGCIVTSPNSILEETVDYPIVAVTGAEVITGSTRMKSGTAQKMICNIISTTAMIKMGKVYQNLMIDVQPTNEKLVSRAIRIISDATGVNGDVAAVKLKKFKGVKKTIFAILSGIEDQEEVTRILNNHKGHIRKALKEVGIND